MGPHTSSRGSALGQVPGELVAAAFAVFNPAVVVPAVAHGWALTDAATIATAGSGAPPPSWPASSANRPAGLAQVTALLAPGHRSAPGGGPTLVCRAALVGAPRRPPSATPGGSPICCGSSGAVRRQRPPGPPPGSTPWRSACSRSCTGVCRCVATSVAGPGHRWTSTRPRNACAPASCSTGTDSPNSGVPSARRSRSPPMATCGRFHRGPGRRPRRAGGNRRTVERRRAPGRWLPAVRAARPGSRPTLDTFCLAGMVSLGSRSTNRTRANSPP